MKVVLDTNVLISGTFWTGEAFKLMQFIEHKKFECFISKEIFQEYLGVLHSDEIVEKADAQNLAVKYASIKVLEMCTLVNPVRKLNVVLEDSEDNKIIECAVQAKADYVISYDWDLLKLKEFEGIQIVLPKTFLQQAKL